MNSVKLKLNLDKTESIIIGDKHNIESIIPKLPVRFSQNSITPADEVKTLKTSLTVIFVRFAVPAIITSRICNVSVNS